MPETDQVKKTIELLADEVSYGILKSAVEGLKATTKKATEFGVTPRQYYRRMAPLLKMGLIEKYGKMYKATLLGNKVLKLYDNFAGIVAHSQKLRLLDKIMKIEDVSPADLQVIKQALGATSYEEARSLKVVTSYEELVNEVIRLIDLARETLAMATRYKDYSVTQAIARAVKRGVECRFIAEERHNLASRVGFQSSLLRDQESTRAFIDMVKAPNFKVRYKDLLYSFMVVDSKHIGIEFADQMKPDNFGFGISAESVNLASVLLKSFEDIWEVTKEIPIEIPRRTD